MKFKIASALAALTLLLTVQTADARGSGGGVSHGPPPVASLRNLGDFNAVCNSIGDAADSSFQSNPNFGPTVQLRATNFGFASTDIDGLESQAVGMYGSFQFFVSGPANNLGVLINFTTPGASSSTTRFFTLANGGIRPSTTSNLYFIGTNNANGSTQIQAGSRINAVQFQLQGSGGSRITDILYNVSFTGYGGCGVLADPAAFCSSGGG